MQKPHPLIEIFGQTPDIDIVIFLMVHGFDDYSQKEIAKYTGLARQTIAKRLPVLIRYKLAKVKRTIGHSSMYQFNASSKQAEALVNMHNSLVNIIVEEEKAIMKAKK